MNDVSSASPILAIASPKSWVSPSVLTCTPGGKKPFKPAGKNGLIADRKGRRVLVQRTGSEEARARNEEEANGYGPPRRPKRGYHGKRDLKPLDE